MCVAREITGHCTSTPLLDAFDHEVDGLAIARRLRADPAAGVDVCIAKPIVPQTLVDQIEAVAGAAAARGEGPIAWPRS